MWVLLHFSHEVTKSGFSCFAFGTTFSKGGLEEAPNTHRVQQTLPNVNKECVHNDDR